MCPISRVTAPRATAALALLAGAARPLRAQPPASHDRPGFVFAAVGVDPTPRYAPGPALTGVGGYEYRFGRSRVGVRVEGDYWRAIRRYDAPDPATANGRTPARQITTVSGGGGALTFQLPAVGRLRPYVLGGVGYQQLSLRNESDPVGENGGASRTIVFEGWERRNSMTYSAGLGAAARAGFLAMFAEVRVIALPNGGARGGRPIQSTMVPLTIGVRF